MKYIIVTGGVMSGLGKGITAASIGRILKNKGYKVTAVKIDPYINIDAGTMSPYQHGEAFVLKDGGEVDLDLGDYERFLDAVRQIHREEPPENIMFIHVTLVMEDLQGEQKTKPSQHSVKELRALGLSPEVIVARSKSPLQEGAKEKIALFCDVPQELVISAYDADDIYEVPLVIEGQGLTTQLMKHLKLESSV